MIKSLPSPAVATVSLFVVLLIALHAEPAQASRAPVFRLDTPDLAAPLLFTSMLHFGVVDAVFAISGRPMPIWLSLLQIGVGGLLLPAIALNADSSPGIVTLAATNIVWFTGHGIYNLVVYPEFRRERLKQRPREREKRERRENLRPHHGWSVQPLARGGMFHFYAAL